MKHSKNLNIWFALLFVFTSTLNITLLQLGHVHKALSAKIMNDGFLSKLMQIKTVMLLGYIRKQLSKYVKTSSAFSCDTVK